MGIQEFFAETRSDDEGIVEEYFPPEADLPPA
jgi:hypothetical protein